MNVRRLISGTAIAAATALGLGALSACSSDSSAADRDISGRLDVVASFYPMQYLAEQIGGRHVSISTLTEPGQEPHDLEISAKQTVDLQKADAVLYLKGLQPAVDEAVSQSEAKTKIDAATLTTLEKHGSTEHSHEGEEAPSDEDASALDPHVWLDPVKYAEIADGVSAAFQKADPTNAAEYKLNTEALTAKLTSLNTSFEDGLKNTKTKVFFTNHAAFGYLAERYGLTQEAITGVDPDSEPSAARMKELQQEAKADGVTTVFYETLVSDKTAKTLAEDANLTTNVLDPLEGITEKSRGDDYIAVMKANLKALRTALGAK
ncbi:metal ABC transporter substrate-binding protein [Streptomyces sp. SID12501]|uniref:Zinc ABC transporter substrate-binding protein n=1 Tax=Streptomyces sp. SID12501 TaxID=2706042 RepID=A0A6B3C125_9ACTN|nr:zinc ABC transporter substrate-binding protein [Streptomyces sp. SID12501]NEC90371.1 zinc ABC transporter substrate-binding protein [Streptomyces sp. SID12501]